MAMLSGGGHGSRSYTYTTRVVTKSYTLAEAVEKAACGELDASQVFAQMPTELKRNIDEYCEKQYSQKFTSLNLQARHDVMKQLDKEIKGEVKAEPVSLHDALKLASQGKIDDLKVFAALPREMQQLLDELAKAVHTTSFSQSKPEERKLMLGGLLQAADEADDRNEPPNGHESARKDEGNKAMPPTAASMGATVGAGNTLPSRNHVERQSADRHLTSNSTNNGIQTRPLPQSKKPSAPWWQFWK